MPLINFVPGTGTHTGTISGGDQPIAECNKSSGLRKHRRNPPGPPIRPFRGTKEGFFKQ